MDDCCASEDTQNSVGRKRKPEGDPLTGDHRNSTSVGESSGNGDLCKSYTSGSLTSNIPNSFNFDMSSDQDDVDDDEDLDYASDYYENNDFFYQDDYASMQDQFDSVDLPPGVEATVPWLKNLESSECNQEKTAENSKGKVEEKEDIVMQKYREFKQFDIVDAFPGHHFGNEGLSELQRQKNWAKKIQEEWKILEENLPESIFVRVCESRMELLRAVIVGPKGTPYHDGLFFFDCLFPDNYPASPPKVHYHSGGLRLNPNLYACGKVCLSLLGTWQGKNSENWIADKSTMLQVLVSIQALILNEKPFFNEPGYSSRYVGSEGQTRSKEYNDNTFALSLKTMMFTLRNPPKHFEDFVAGHFRACARNILMACKSYADGSSVGEVAHNIAYCSKASINKQKEFQAAVGRMMNTLIAFFTKNGSTDVDEFRSADLYKISPDANLEVYKV
ncbi:hypothetical protein L6164_026716 [Bauhinia variegata]|uniref:Uncharacterized protein n=1 Tax=Bauhinia variegata TaxID=167791 RepID=A0ACB9LRA6_BAUVA|nr:hypothetical protein L6164_026716 [Bauhinia variegata]